MFEIETQNLTKNFGRLVAVNNLNLQISKGTIFGFLDALSDMTVGLSRKDAKEAKSQRKT